MKTSQRHPALLIDRDGTINRDCPYCHDAKDLYVYDKAVDLIKHYAGQGYFVIVVTNQSGINRGYFTEDDMHRFNSALKERVESMGGRIDDFFYCPHRPDENCACRKPRTGLMDKILTKYDLDLSSSLMVGDQYETDGLFAKNVGIPFVLIHNDGEMAEKTGNL